MNNNRRRNFRPRSQKNNFRRRNGSVNSNSSNFSGNVNVNYNRNGSMNNVYNVEKAMQKFNQLAKDAQTNGDPILAQNYLQHADHYLRRYNELNMKKESSLEKKIEENTLEKVNSTDTKN